MAEHLLACAITYRDASVRDTPLPLTFASATSAVAELMAVLLHEAREAMMQPLDTPPTQPYLHPVDVDTDEPGIVDARDEPRVLRRKATTLPRIVYTARPTAQGARRLIVPLPSPPNATLAESRSVDEARRESADAQSRTLVAAEKRAATSEKRQARETERKRARAEETEDARAERLALARQKREERKKKKAAESEATAAPTTKAVTLLPPEPPSEEALLVPDVSSALALAPPPSRRRRKKGDATQFYQHPLPHHRHLDALQQCAPNAQLLSALLTGEASEAIELIQGPPGTGKTRRLVQRASTLPGRILLVAPTNVGAANLYVQCLAQGLGDECALTLPPERLPPGTPVASADPLRRLVCATVSARAGPILHDQSFQAVLVDEAAMCMEAWTWTLLRPEVEHLVLAGDVRQLPAQTSDTGRTLAHDRSLMERLLALDYDNVVRLTEQHRMAPDLLALANSFYDNALTLGSGAPTEGRWEVRRVEGTEERVGTSFVNRAEATEAARAARDLGENVVLLTGYLAQCQVLLAQKTGCEVHTVDSFQGREADAVVLSLVRSSGRGFWDDPRRLTVALTRARRRLIILASSDDIFFKGRLVNRSSGA